MTEIMAQCLSLIQIGKTINITSSNAHEKQEAWIKIANWLINDTSITRQVCKEIALQNNTNVNVTSYSNIYIVKVTAYY